MAGTCKRGHHAHVPYSTKAIVLQFQFHRPNGGTIFFGMIFIDISNIFGYTKTCSQEWRNWQTRRLQVPVVVYTVWVQVPSPASFFC